MISAAFTIDTRDADTVVRALALSTAKDSASFTIDTRDPDSVVFPFSGVTSAWSGFFTIDTMAGQLNPDHMVRHHDELA